MTASSIKHQYLSGVQIRCMMECFVKAHVPKSRQESCCTGENEVLFPPLTCRLNWSAHSKINLNFSPFAQYSFVFKIIRINENSILKESALRGLLNCMAKLSGDLWCKNYVKQGYVQTITASVVFTGLLDQIVSILRELCLDGTPRLVFCRLILLL